MQGLGKRLGPDLGWSFTWLWIIPVIILKLLIRMTLTSPTLLLTMTRKADVYERHLRDAQFEIFLEIFRWFFYLSWMPLAILICNMNSLIQLFSSIIIYTWKLYWHKDGRSIFQMLRDPCGHDSPETHPFLSDSHGNRIRQKTNRRRETSRPWRRKSQRLSSKSSVSDRPPVQIKGYDKDLCMFSFYQMDRANINRCEHGGQTRDDNTVSDAADETMALTEYFASTFFCACKIILGKRPRKPPDGYLAALLVLILVISFYSFFTLIGTWHIVSRLPSYLTKKKKKKKKRRKRSLEAIQRRKDRHLLKRSSLSDGDSEKAIDASESSSEGAVTDQACISPNIGAFVTSLADVDTETLNTQVPFDTNSIFFVCDNSTTGHICNDIGKFVPGTLRDSGRQLTTANGTGPILREGTVHLLLRDDNGKKHVFILDDCIYHPDSPVNLLSTRRLAEKFLDEDGNPDEETNIQSKYSSHTLTWARGQFTRTFPTPVSGLPELLLTNALKIANAFALELAQKLTLLVRTSFHSRLMKSKRPTTYLWNKRQLF